MPAGSETLESLPVVRPGTSPADLVRSEPNEDELHEYCVAIRRTARVFAKAHVKKGTLAEHDQYTVWVAMYMQLSGFGTFVIVDDSVRLIGRTRRVRAPCVRAWSTDEKS